MKEFVCKYTIDFKPIEEELGIRKAQVMKEGGIESFVVVFQDLEKWKSSKQNRLFHALLTIFFKSGCYSHQIETLKELKDYYKYQVGLIDYYLYFDGEAIKRAKTVQDIPPYISKQKACRIILKSWREASKKQAREAIELLKVEMISSTIESTSYGKQFNEILQELEK